MAEEPATQIDDDEIALRLMERDGEGMRLLLQVHGPMVLGFLRKYHPHVADDAFQEATTKVWQSVETFDDARGSLGSWFLAIARNAALDLRRHEGRRAHKSLDAMEGFDPVWDCDGDDTGSDEEVSPTRLDAMRAVLLEILDTLSPLQQRIVMRDAEHPTGKAEAADLADEFGSTANSIRGNRSKAWKTIGEELAKRGFPARRND